MHVCRPYDGSLNRMQHVTVFKSAVNKIGIYLFSVVHRADSAKPADTYREDINPSF